MDKKIIIELIKLEVLNLCTPEDSDALKFLKRNNENFPWKEYGDYQNLIAVLSLRQEKLMPRQNLKDEIITKAAKLKNITITETVLEEIKEKEKPVINISKGSDEEIQESENLKNDFQLSENNSEEIIEEIDISEPEEDNEPEAITDPMDNFILLKQPELYRLNNDEEKSAEEIKESDLQLKNTSSEKKSEDVLNNTTKSFEENIDEINEEIISEENDETTEYEIEELIISEEQVVDDSISTGSEDYYEKKPSGEINRTHRKSKSSLFVFAAVVIISAPLIFLMTSSSNDDKTYNEVEKQVSKKPEKIEMIEDNVQSSKTSDINGVVSVEGINEVIEEDLIVKINETKTNQLPPVPEPVIVEPKPLDIVENNSNNFSENILKSEPPKEKLNENQEPGFFVAVEEMPQPVGGLAEIQKRVVYPRIASISGTEGKVIIQAIVDESGNVSDAKVIKGIGYGCDEAALKAVLETEFTPGKQRGKPVKVRVTIPIVFKKS